MRKFNAIILSILFGVIGYIGRDAYDWVKYKILPATDQMTQIQGSIEALTETIDENTKLILSSEDARVISKYIVVIANSAKELNQKAIELNKVTKIVSGNNGQFATITPRWIPFSRAIQLDNKNTFSVIGKVNNTDYSYSLNGKRGRLVPGSRIEYEGIRGNTCYINFIGREGDLYGVSLHCD